MLSNLLRSERAVQMSVMIIRAFIRLREFIGRHEELAGRIDDLETNRFQHASVINSLAEEIDGMKAAPAQRRRIGFRA
jgi:hypothetical protein